MMKRKHYVVVTLFAVFVLISLRFFLAITPSGATVTAGTPQTAPNDTPQSAAAYAGNTTYLSISGFTTTQSWQGYFGNITGVIQLADNNDNVMYNWTLLNPSGEVYASTNSTIKWTNIQCFNYTAAGNFSSDDGAGGTTNRFGINLTTLEAMYGVLWDDVDGVNETFTFLGGGHDAFTTASQSFSVGECYSTRVYNETAPVANQFEEALLYEPNTTSVVFASIIEENGINGFNDENNDFEMLVLENGHGTDVTSTTYFFYVELE